jgi:DMSO/TMAO reductase YedYZ molybdopterin-dependent catalytic subunit
MAAVVVADLPAPDGGEFGVDPERIRYYESIDLIGAAHPQTILAYDMNGKPLTVPHGAPLRLRLERQLGYKMTKYIMRIALAPSLADLDGGRGGNWEDRGYECTRGSEVFPPVQNEAPLMAPPQVSIADLKRRTPCPSP